MNLELLCEKAGQRVVRYALTGAKGGFGRTLLAQTRYTPLVEPVVLCDLDTDGVKDMLIDLGMSEHQYVVASDSSEVAEAIQAGRIAIVADAGLLTDADFDVLVEGTGKPAFGYRVAKMALEGGKHVAMVSKEVDSVVGVRLAQIANEHDVVYTTADGDQPANLIQWVVWARTLGLEIVAAGKASEYDLVYDRQAGTLSQLSDVFDVPDFESIFTLGNDVAQTLEARADVVGDLHRRATADYCEIGVVSNNTGLLPDAERLHYPIARTAELADIYALREDGGIISEPGRIDVFSALRASDEASFAGGVFVVVRTNDPETWEMLRGKGHVVSRNGKYAALYLPYHFMGVETPTTLLSAALLGLPSGARKPQRVSILAGRANRTLTAGSSLIMGGHHHDVEGVDAILIPATEAPRNVAPLYLASFATLTRDVAAGEIITMDDIEGFDAELFEAWNSGESEVSTETVH